VVRAGARLTAMGAFLAFLPASGRAPSSGSLAGPRAWVETRQRLRPLDEAWAGAGVVKFGRRSAPASPLARGPEGWLAGAGTWHHPEIPGRDDSAGLLRLLGTSGAAALDRLDGSYAIAWLDARSGDLVVATEPLGRLHVFCAETEEGAFVGTSAVALARAGAAEPDPVAVHEFLATGTVYGDRSPFLRVRRLAGGCRHLFRAGRRAGSVRSADSFAGGRGSPEAVLEAVRAALDAFVCGVARPLADLTGGLDSRLVVAAMLDAGLRPDVTVTGPSTSRDVIVARRLAQALGLRLLHEPPEPGAAARGSFDRVIDAAALADGMIDAAEYAFIASVHEPHAREYDCSVNGSGGEVLRDYWWTQRHLDPAAPIDVDVAARRFTALALPPPFLQPAPIPDLHGHFAEVVADSLASTAGRPATARLDHLYLDVRMQCWQGAIASATNRIWPAISPLLARGAVAEALAVEPRRRLGARLFRELFRRFPHAIRDVPLESGFPPRGFGLLSAWCAVPGIAAAPGRFARRAWRRLGRGRRLGAAPDAAAVALLASGAGDYLDFGGMALGPLLDAARYRGWLDVARTGASTASPILGRLVALEAALRAGREEGGGVGGGRRGAMYNPAQSSEGQ